MGVADNPSFRIVGEVRIGEIPKLSIRAGEAVRIPTGAYIPPGANTVVMIEYAQVEQNGLRITKPAESRRKYPFPGAGFEKRRDLVSCRYSSATPAHCIALYAGDKPIPSLLKAQSSILLYRRRVEGHRLEGGKNASIRETSQHI